MSRQPAGGNPGHARSGSPAEPRHAIRSGATAALLSLGIAIIGSSTARGAPNDRLAVNATDPAPGAPFHAAVKIDTLATGLSVPWSFDFAPDGRIFLTERTGRVRILNRDGLQDQPWAVLPVFSEHDQIRPESGLMGIAVAPDFAETGHVFVTGTFWKWGASPLVRRLERIFRRFAGLFSAEFASPWENRIYRLTDRDGVGVEPRIIVDGLPANFYHAGGALAFGPDGMLYVTTGEALRSPEAQDPGSLIGKVLRYRPDGTIPSDNPRSGSPVYASGFRNPQGLEWHPDGRELFVIDHGPSFLPHEQGRFGNDELNLVTPGADYGWPIEAGIVESPRFRPPLISWSPAIAPAALAVYTGPFSPWWGNFFISGLRGRQLRRVAVSRRDEHGWTVTADEELLSGSLGRIRSVRMGPDGYLYLATSNRDGRGEPTPADDLLLRMVPARAPANATTVLSPSER